MRGWTREQFFAFLSLLVSIFAVAATIMFPEFRRMLGLDSETIGQFSTTSTALAPSTIPTTRPTLQRSPTYTPTTVVSIVTLMPSTNTELFASGFWGPFGIAFNVDGDLFVANEGDGGGGTIVSRVSSTGQSSLFATGFNSPAAVAFNSLGDLYVSDEGGIYAVSETGELNLYIPSSIGLGNPNAMAFDHEDNLYVVGTGDVRTTSGVVSKFDSAGGLINPSFAVGFRAPQGIAVDDDRGVLFISDGDGRIYQVNKVTGATNLYIEALGGSNGGLARDNEGNLYMSVSELEQVFRIDAVTQRATICVGGIRHPRGLTFDQSGNLYITSYDTGQIFRVDGC